MKYSVKIIFGKEQVNKFILNNQLSETDKQIYEKEYFFETKSELDAFKKGVLETVGWLECYILEDAFV